MQTAKKEIYKKFSQWYVQYKRTEIVFGANLKRRPGFTRSHGATSIQTSVDVRSLCSLAFPVLFGRPPLPIFKFDRLLDFEQCNILVTYI